jgi:hypothetical protein
MTHVFVLNISPGCHAEGSSRANRYRTVITERPQEYTSESWNHTKVVTPEP